ncbi:MAG: type 1 glutamine amidotransferase [bacterium]|nr:type 1 glutamine amidotransferase [bacterium]
MRDQARILLLQARGPDDPAKGEEVRSFAARCGIGADKITPWDLIEGPPSMSEIRRHDVLMVGGAGEFYVSKSNLPYFDQTLDHLREVVEFGFPTFASCFGFQCMVVALGGEIVYDSGNMEVGTFDVSLTEEGRSDELFGSLPETFQAQLGRKDRAAGHWDGVVPMAFSERCPVQALRIPGKPVWASQFHPELDREANLGRFERYLDGYAAVMSPEELEATIDGFGDSPEVNQLLKRFLGLVLD